MIKRPSIGEMNRRIVIKSVTSQQPDGYGGLTNGTDTVKGEFWVKADQVKSYKTDDNSQQVLSNTWKFTGRDRLIRHAIIGDFISFNNQTLVVQSVTTDFVYTDIIAEVRNG